jgi:hypothetical protein
MTTREEIFNIWAPRESVWSPWVKPVLFAHLDETNREIGEDFAPMATPWAPPSEERVALILDLPGADGIACVADLIRRGYRPIPLYNSAPGPVSAPSVVNTTSTRAALQATSPELAQANLVTDAPPAFLLDATRRLGQIASAPGIFDNRSITFVTDFPSATFLKHQRIAAAMLVQKAGMPQADLANTLRRWQEAGIPIRLLLLDSGEPSQPCTIAKPSWMRLAFHRAAALFGFRRNPMGGFGGMEPFPSAG